MARNSTAAGRTSGQPDAHARDRVAEQAFIEEMAMQFELQARLPRIAGRIYALMLISDQSSFTQQAVAEELNVSLASVSSMMRRLAEVSLIERIAVPGARRDHFRLVRTSWANVARDAQLAARRYAEIAEMGLSLPGPDISPGRQQLREFRDMTRRLEHWIEQSITGDDEAGNR